MESKTITRGALVDAALDLNKVLDLEPGIAVKNKASQLRSELIEAAALLKTSDVEKLAPATIAIIASLRDEIIAVAPEAREDEVKESGLQTVMVEVTAAQDAVAQVAQVEAAPAPESGKAKPKAEKKAKSAANLGAFKPVNRETIYGKLLAAVIGGATSLAAVAEAAEMDVEKARAVLARGRASNGIDFKSDGDLLEIKLPKGVNAEKVWAPEKIASAPRAPRAAAVPGAFKPIKRDTQMHTFLRLAAEGKTLEEIAAGAGTKANGEKYVAADSRFWLTTQLLRSHNVKGVVDKASKTVTVEWPEGKTLDDCIRG